MNKIFTLFFLLLITYQLTGQIVVCQKGTEFYVFSADEDIYAVQFNLHWHEGQFQSVEFNDTFLEIGSFQDGSGYDYYNLTWLSATDPISFSEGELLLRLNISPEPSYVQWDNQFLFFGENQKLMEVIVDCPTTMKYPIVKDDVIFKIGQGKIETNVQVHVFSVLGRHLKSGVGEIYLDSGQAYFVVVNGMTRKIFLN
jgi:hypothetical protein